MMEKKSALFKSVIFTLIGMAFFLINNLCHAQIIDEDIILGKHVKLYSDILNEERSLFVHLPNGYEKSQAKYPVLYLLDGGNIFRFSKVIGTVGKLAFENIPNMIIVGIKNTDRERDMFPMKTESDPTSGGGDNFLNFFSEELIPFVDKNYRTENFRVLSGASNSAFFTVYALMENPNFFSAYIASSPTALGWLNNLMYKKLDELKKKNVSLNKRLYLIYGENDYTSILKAIPGFTKIIEENAPNDFLWEIKLIKDEGHVPYNSIYEGLQFVFSDWKYPRERLKEATFREVKTYYNQLSEKYGYNIEIPVMVLINLGNDMVSKNKVDEALEIHKYNVKLYPNNTMPHFYLGLAYEKNGEIALAVKHIKKAVELDSSWARAKRKLDELNKK